MVENELFEYIKSLKEKGISDEVIKSHLLKHNYSNNIVDEAFKEQKPLEIKVNVENNTSNQIQNTTQPLTKKRSFPKLALFLILLLLFLGGAIAIIYFFNIKIPFSDSDPEECNSVSIAIHKESEMPVICVFPDYSKIQLILENNGERVINKVEISLKGSKQTVTDELNNINLIPSDVFPRVISYNLETQGEVKQIAILPILMLENKEEKCYSKTIFFNKLSTC